MQIRKHRESRSSVTESDRNQQRCGVLSAIFAFTPYGAMRADTLLQVARLVQMKLGIALRATAIAQLGRFRTPNVAVLADHRIVERGLYRHIRHPS
ncbi:MAG: isoprenylcysteine carboxylmethyltransferase family protein, partial [Metallibacterium sp.]